MDSTRIGLQNPGWHGDEAGPSNNYQWSELLARVFGIDVLKYHCGGGYKPLGAIKDP